MSYINYTRNKDAILNAMELVPSGELIAKTPLKIIFPVNYEEKDLASITDKVHVLGIFAIIVGNNYATNVLPAKVNLFPSEIGKYKEGESDYYVLEFEKGSVITDNINVVKEETLGYYIYNYFIALGRVPWYLSALDLLTLFDHSGKYTGKTYGVNHVILEMIISSIMRDSQDLNKYWRQTLPPIKRAIYDNKPDVIPLRNVPYGARNTLAKLMGSYFDEGLNSALINPSTTTEKIEALLRQ